MEEYIVSARKYRPANFDSVVGQKALTATLKNVVKSGKLAHAYLFCGPRGVGKTTCARIFAKAINCLSPTAEGEACGECESCVSFAEQRSLNIFELDAASNNSVENIKSLMEQTRIPPQVGKYKVFIIDEVHMLSTAAFNAFLKTLEEPPAHVIFILATTEKHKILPTILSRCQIYDFERMNVRNTIDHLKSVAQQEGITFEEEALAVIAEKADGGMRDALSIFDQAASFCQGNITYKKVIDDLNVLDTEYYFRILDLSLANKVSDIMVLLNNIINTGMEGGQIANGLAKHVRNVLMAKDESTLPLLEVSDRQRQLYKEQAQKCDTRFLYQALRILNQCDVNYRQSSNKRLLVELTLIEVAQITQPDDSASAGRSPKRLKTLFKNLIMQSSQPQQRAPQVAPAEPKHNGTTPQQQQQAANAQQPAANAQQQATTPQQPTATYQKGARPVLKTSQGRLGNSWTNVQAKSQQTTKIVVNDLGIDDSKTVAANEDMDFTQHDVEFQWLSMCNRMPQKYSALATRLKNITPVITSFPNIEVAVDNKLIQEQIEEIKGSICKTFQVYLHNQNITFSIRLDEQKQQIKILTRKEQFEEMVKQNPNIGKLKELLNLELA